MTGAARIVRDYGGRDEEEQIAVVRDESELAEVCTRLELDQSAVTRLQAEIARVTARSPAPNPAAASERRRLAEEDPAQGPDAQQLSRLARSTTTI